MTVRAFVSLVFIAAAATTAVLIWGSDSDTPTTQSKAPTPGEQTITGAAERSESASQGIPLATNKGLQRIALRVQGHPEPGYIVHVTGAPASKVASTHWNNLANFASFVALHLMETPPPGLRIEVDANAVSPAIEHMAALVIGIQLGASRKIYPPDQLVTGLVTPTGALIPIVRQHAERLAAQHGLHYNTAPTVGSLMAKWGTVPRPAPSAPTQLDRQPLPPNEPDANLRNELRAIIGTIASGRPARRPLPENWNRLIDQLHSRLRSARGANATALMDLAMGGARALEGAQLADFGAERLASFSARIARRDDRQLAGWELSWLVLLLESRILGESAVRRGFEGLPASSVESTDAAPAEWMARRSRQLGLSADHTRALLDWVRPQTKGQPNAYPWSDARHLVWRNDESNKAPSALSGLGRVLDRTLMLWAQIVITHWLDPKRNLDVAHAGALHVAHPSRLDNLLTAARKSLLTAAAKLGAARIAVPKIVTRVVREGNPKAGSAPHVRVHALERIMIATALCRETALVANQMAKGINGN